MPGSSPARCCSITCSPRSRARCSRASRPGREGAACSRCACLLGVSSMIDAIVILLAWAGGYALAIHLFGEAGRMDLRQTMFLNAFLLVEIIKVGLRSLLAPRFAALRLVPLSDLLANYWYFWLSRITGLLGYGMLLAVPIVSANLPLRIGEALEYGVALTALVMAIVVIAAEPAGAACGARRQGAGGDRRAHRPADGGRGTALAPARDRLLPDAVRRLAASGRRTRSPSCCAPRSRACSCARSAPWWRPRSPARSPAACACPTTSSCACRCSRAGSTPSCRGVLKIVRWLVCSPWC